MTRAIKRRNFEQEIIALECRVEALTAVAREANLALVHAIAVIAAVRDADTEVLREAADHARQAAGHLRGVLGR